MSRWQDKAAELRLEQGMGWDDIAQEIASIIFVLYIAGSCNMSQHLPFFKRASPPYIRHFMG